MCTTCFVLMRWRTSVGTLGSRRRSSSNARGAPCMETTRTSSPSNIVRVPNLASQIRVAFSRIAWNTGSSSPGELEITRSTSEVAVCCSSASDNSRVRACTSSNSRTFSIAITAWSANVWTRSICCWVNGSTATRVRNMTPTGVPPRRRGTPRAVRKLPSFCASCKLNSGSASTSWT
jgi:hypothetical protein